MLLLAAWTPILSIRPVLEPEGTVLWVDADQHAHDPDGPVRVTPSRHLFKLSHYEEGQWHSRQFEVSGSRLFHAWSGNERPLWSLLYPTAITSDKKGTQLEIKRQEGPFDPDFLRIEYLEQHHLAKLDNARVLFSLEAQLNTATTELPVGHYELTPKSKGCTVKEPRVLNVSPDKGAFKFPVKIQCTAS